MTVHVPRRLGAALAVALCAVALPSAAGAATPAPDAGIPTEIQVPAGNKLFLEVHAVGVQIYDCRAAGVGFAWSPATPRADLYGENGQLVGSHYGGPTWEAKDGSKVLARRDTGVTVDPTAIQWLRLSTVSATPGADGDRLAGTTYIQRVATVGGLQPAAADCNALTAGTRQEIPYSTDYRFWKASDD